MPHENDPANINIDDAILQAVILWVCAKTDTTFGDAETEITATFNGFHLSRFAETGPAKIAEMFRKYNSGDD
jgi:hypothetical protein|tara:strand:+ start:2021 stop:2236 length:216 start_codon:yes stop_codon:yes gene_type:complete